VHPKSTAAAAAFDRYFSEPSNYGHAAKVAAMVLEQLPNGEHAWLRPATPDPDTRYMLTDKGRRDLRIAEALGCDPDAEA